MPNINLRESMIQEIAQSYDISKRGFKIGGHIITLTLDDIHNIMGLQISGNDLSWHIEQNAKREEDTVASELFLRFANEHHKIDLTNLENMLHKERQADDDFIRAFVLFTIGILLASTTSNTISWKYIEDVRDVQWIYHFN